MRTFYRCEMESSSSEIASSSLLSLSTNSETELEASQKSTQNESAQDSLPCILDGRFFIYLEAESTNTKRVAICKTCQPKEVKISGFNNSTSNFITHLKRRHGERVFKEYQSHLKNVRKGKQFSRKHTRCRQADTSDRNEEPAEQTISQEQLNDNILKFFIHSMIPLQAIEDPFLKKIFDSFSMNAKGLNIINRRTLGCLIDDYYLKEITNVKIELQNVKEVSTAADIWSSKNRRFFGVTAHWLDSNLKRKTKTLACRRFSGALSYDRIAPLLESVHAEFGLDSQKVLSTVNDNSYFNILNQVDPLASIDHSQSTILELPVHLRCCAHKLNLCATADANKVLRNKETTIAHIHNQVIKKCNHLWNIADRPTSAEIIHNIVGHTLAKPENTKWNSLYDALHQIALIQDKSVQLHMALGLTNVLGYHDFQYINEYLHCLKPIAEALDMLQGDQDMYYGILLPCILSLRKKLQKLTRESLIYCKILALKYLESVEERFAEFFDISTTVAQSAAIAAMSYPRFKDEWIVCVSTDHHSRIKSIFRDAVVNEILESRQSSETFHVTPKNDNNYGNSYFTFETDSSETDPGDTNQVQRSKADAIVSQYLADQDRDVSMLDKYTEIRSVFKKYNTPLPSSGPVERLFSNATMTNLPKSHRLSDEMFEKRILLKSNLSCP